MPGASQRIASSRNCCRLAEDLTKSSHGQAVIDHRVELIMSFEDKVLLERSRSAVVPNRHATAVMWWFHRAPYLTLWGSLPHAAVADLRHDHRREGTVIAATAEGYDGSSTVDRAD